MREKEMIHHQIRIYGNVQVSRFVSHPHIYSDAYHRDSVVSQHVNTISFSFSFQFFFFFISAKDNIALQTVATIS